MRKGLILITAISIAIIAAVLFLPLPYYQSTDLWCESYPPQLCESKGWHLRPSFWREISGDLEQTVSHSPSPSSERFVGAGCKISGCSGEVCDEESQATICMPLPGPQCYNNVRCEKQANGQCGWAQTPELQACLEKFSN